MKNIIGGGGVKKESFTKKERVKKEKEIIKYEKEQIKKLNKHKDIIV